MVLELGKGGVNSVEDLDGFPRVKPGRYHFVLTDSDDTFTNSEAFIVKAEVLAGTNPTEIGKEHKEYMSISNAALRRIKRLALVMGIITPEQALQPLVVDFTPWHGIGQFVADVIEEEYEGRKKAKFGFLDFFTVDSPEAKGIPMNRGALELLTPATASAPQQAAPAADLAPARPAPAPAPAPTPTPTPAAPANGSEWGSV